MNDSPEQSTPCLALVPVTPLVKKSNAGRPTIMTQEIIDKLEYVFSLGGTDKEACLFADISIQTLYNYQERHPEFVERKELLKERPVLLARKTIVEKLGDLNNAQWFLTRKRRKEFAEKPPEPKQNPVNIAVVNGDINDDTQAKIQRIVIGIAAGAEERVNGRGVRDSQTVPASGMEIPSTPES